MFRSVSLLAKKKFNVTVVGAAGGIGQPLSMLLKLDSKVNNLKLYDLAPVTKGVAADLSHIPTSEGKTEGFIGNEELPSALEGADLVVIPAGVPRKPGMTRDDLFNINAGIVGDTVSQIAKTCPEAAILIISNPVNSTVPLAKEILNHYGKYDAKKLFGVTTLDMCRAQTFLGEHGNVAKQSVSVPVVGGHAGKTIMTLLSQSNVQVEDVEDRKALTHRIMFGGDEVVQAKAGGGSATLSMAYAGAVFANQVMNGLSGESVSTYAYVDSPLKHAPFFASRVTLGESGVEEIHDVGSMDAREEELFNEMLEPLNAEVAKGVKFGQEYVAKL